MATPAFNLLPPELRHRSLRTRRSYWLGVALLVCAVLVGGYDLHLVSETRSLRRDAAVQSARAQAMQADTESLRRLQQEEAVLKERQARYEALRGAEWSALWQGVQTALPQGVSVQGLTFGPGTGSLSGSAPGLPVLAQTEERLAAVPGVSEVRLQSVRGEAGGRVTFALRLSLSGAYASATAVREVKP
ncbi:MAG: PilN domain-containing protein [Symbiobacteriia bacterium]